MPNYDKYKSKGALFINHEKSGKQPDFRGFIELTSAQVQRVKEMVAKGQEPKIQLAVFKKRSAAGDPYLFVSTEAYMKEESPDDGWGEQPSPTPPKKANDGWGDESAQDDFADDVPF